MKSTIKILVGVFFLATINSCSSDDEEQCRCRTFQIPEDEDVTIFTCTDDIQFAFDPNTYEEDVARCN